MQVGKGLRISAPIVSRPQDVSNSTPQHRIRPLLVLVSASTAFFFSLIHLADCCNEVLCSRRGHDVQTRHGVGVGVTLTFETNSILSFYMISLELQVLDFCHPFPLDWPVNCDTD